MPREIQPEGQFSAEGTERPSSSSSSSSSSRRQWLVSLPSPEGESSQENTGQPESVRQVSRMAREFFSGSGISGEDTTEMPPSAPRPESRIPASLNTEGSARAVSPGRAGYPAHLQELSTPAGEVLTSDQEQSDVKQIGTDEEIKKISITQVKSFQKRYEKNTAYMSSLEYVIRRITHPEAKKRVEEWRKLEAGEDNNIKRIMEKFIEHMKSAMRQEAMRQEAMRQEAMRQEAMRQEAMRQEAMRQEAMRQELQACSDDEIKKISFNDVNSLLKKEYAPGKHKGILSKEDAYYFLANIVDQEGQERINEWRYLGKANDIAVEKKELMKKLIEEVGRRLSYGSLPIEHTRSDMRQEAMKQEAMKQEAMKLELQACSDEEVEVRRQRQIGSDEEVKEIAPYDIQSAILEGNLSEEAIKNFFGEINELVEKKRRTDEENKSLITKWRNLETTGDEEIRKIMKSTIEKVSGIFDGLMI